MEIFKKTDIWTENNGKHNNSMTKLIREDFKALCPATSKHLDFVWWPDDRHWELVNFIEDSQWMGSMTGSLQQMSADRWLHNTSTPVAYRGWSGHAWLHIQWHPVHKVCFTILLLVTNLTPHKQHQSISKWMHLLYIFQSRRLAITNSFHHRDVKHFKYCMNKPQLKTWPSCMHTYPWPVQMKWSINWIQRISRYLFSRMRMKLFFS